MQKYGKLRRLLVDHGADIGKSEVYEFGPDNFAIKAAVNIKRNDKIVFIPLDYIITE